jgi:P-type conjugative transfer protein TrbG
VRRWWMLVGLCLMGCAGTPDMVKAPPVAEDLVGWSVPTAVAEEAVSPEAPVGSPRPSSSRERVYAYKPGETYKVDVGVGVPMDIVLQPGEEIHNIVGGDRAPAEGQDNTPRWEVQQGYSGLGKQGQPHVFLAATGPGLTTSLVITTTRRTYYVDCRSVARTSARWVRWHYDEEPRVAKPPKPRLLPDPMQPQRYHVGYTIEASEPKPIWTVRQVIDNGAKTYLIFPPTLGTIEAPLVRVIGANGPELLNSRMVGSVLVLDRIINRLELRLGTGKPSEVVTVQRELPITVDCPPVNSGASIPKECPVWPHGQTASREVQP